MKKRFENQKVKEIFYSYPKVFRERLLFLRELIFEVVNENEGMICEETLKWGEPSYITKKGSTLRIAWSSKRPNLYGIYFNCQTTLIETFRIIFNEIFTFEGNRAIIFAENDEIPVAELKLCILTALTYHNRKDKVNLGL